MNGSGKICLLHGEDAVREYDENGADGCINQGYNDVSVIEYDDQTNVNDLVVEVLRKTAGSLETCLISEEAYNAISEAFKEEE